MDIKEKFDKEFGSAFIVEDKSNYPDFYISLGASRICALIDDDKAKIDYEWRPFKARLDLIDEKYGILRFDKDNGYQFYFVRKAIEVLNPNEYILIKKYSKEKDDEAFILHLKNNKYIVAIAPIVSLEEDEFPHYWKVVEWEDFIMKAPKSVFVL